MIFLELSHNWAPGEDTAKDSLVGVGQLMRELRKQKKQLAKMQKMMAKLSHDLEAAREEIAQLKGTLPWPGGSRK